VTKSNTTIHNIKTVMQLDYSKAYIVNDNSRDFILTNLLIDYVWTYPQSSELLPNNNHPFGNYVLNSYLYNSEYYQQIESPPKESPPIESPQIESSLTRGLKGDEIPFVKTSQVA